MRYAIRLDFGMSDCVVVELNDYNTDIAETLDALLWDDERSSDIRKTILEGLNKIAEFVGRFVTYQEVTILREDDFADYQLYIDIETNEYTIYKVYFNTEKIN